MPPAFEVLLLNTAVPQIQAAQAGDTYVVPRDIAFSAALTLSAGTANGVPYLNASKVLTTGSALTFDGTNFANTGPITSSTQLAVNAAQSTDGNLRIYNTTTRASGNKYGIRFADSSFETNAAIYAEQAGSGNNAASLVFGVNAGTGGAVLTSASDQMVLTSTGLGIGTSSPGAKLDVAAASGVVRVTSTTGTNGVYYQASNTGGGLYMGRDDSDGGSFYSGSPAYGAIFLSTGAYPMAFAVDSVERMRLDSSGNLGLGVTPSAWAGGFKVFAIGGNNVWSTNDSNTLYLTQNAYFDGAFKYQGSSLAATKHEMANGEFKWFTAPSGTAGNAISFTQALTLDANRNLLLNGTTAGASAVGTLAIFNGTAPTGSVTDGIILYAEDVSSSSELKVRDEAGNVTTLSPHNFSLIPEGPSEDMAWAYYSEKGGKRINVDMLKLARMVEKLTGEKLVYEN